MANINDLNKNKYINDAGEVDKEISTEVSPLVQNGNDSELGSFNLSNGKKRIVK